MVHRNQSEELQVDRCEKLEGLAHHAYNNLTSLQSLTISSWDAATELISHFTNLTYLELHNVDMGAHDHYKARAASLACAFVYPWLSFTFRAVDRSSASLAFAIVDLAFYDERKMVMLLYLEISQDTLQQEEGRRYSIFQTSNTLGGFRIDTRELKNDAGNHAYLTTNEILFYGSDLHRMDLINIIRTRKVLWEKSHYALRDYSIDDFKRCLME
ncbi:hypothetical protein RHSIM_Rhsim06G0126800 [Rhododendron simsii]|uniref:Uncharacterized protein n=1 Tax=Rhododendron simsii TaxID=118357 RepID=A0A834H2W5_RHOSS|nr:hypothetical protein RHSIM_Rhsim06G0126800 [Rhododendron simsii]